MQYITIFITSGIVFVAAMCVLLYPPVREFASLKLAALALLLFPIAQLLLFVVIIQLDAGASLADGFSCSGLHGGGYHGRCSLFEALVEGAVAAFVFGFATFGLVPLAVFTGLFAAFAAVRRLGAAA